MNQELTLSIEKLVYGGDGLAHTAGDTVFVPFVLPGEEVRAATRERKRKVVWADLLEVTRAAQHRAQPRCPHFFKCGGCHYQHIAQEEQVRLKEGILRETLARLGRIAWDGPIATHSGAPYSYRNRAQWALREALPRALGYFLSESPVILPIDECPILSPRLMETFSRLQEMTRGGALPDGVQEIEAFADSGDERVALNVAFAKFPAPAEQLMRAFRETLPWLESLLLLDEKRNKFELSGPGYLFHEAGGFRYRVSHLSFFQVNRFLLEDLLRAVVGDARGGLALDLYAGVGFFTLPLSQRFERVTAVDANLAATRDLRTNAEKIAMNITEHNEHVEAFLKKTNETPDLVVLDPPRAGLGEESAATLVALGAQEIVYLSCDPSTLARDLSVLTGTAKSTQNSGAEGTRYKIASVDLFDLFPQTFHIETLVKLRKAS
jgi:23S rRNA (uracil1939-C5)-methyltransferase